MSNSFYNEKFVSCLARTEEFLEKRFYKKIKKNKLKDILEILIEHTNNIWLKLLLDSLNGMPSFVNKYYIYLNSRNLKLSNQISIMIAPKTIISKFKKIFESLKMMEPMLRESIKKIDLNLNFEILILNFDLNNMSKFNISFFSPNFIVKNLTKISFRSNKNCIFINDFYLSLRIHDFTKSVYSLDKLDNFLQYKKFYKEFLNEFLRKIYKYQIQNILNKFKFINYEEDIEYSYQLLMEIFRYSKFYYSKIKSISNRVHFKSKNNLKLIFELDNFLNNINFDKLCLLQIWIIYSLLISPFNNELNKDEIVSILEFIKTTNFDYSKEKYEIWKYSISNIELIIYSILGETEQFKNKLSKDDLDTCFDIARMKSQFKNYHTLSFKYLRKIVNLSSNELKNLHDKFVKKINEKEKSKIENINFNIKNKNIFNGKSSEFEYKLIDNSLDLFSLGKYMHNCVYTRLKSIVSNKSLIYQITYKNKDYCLEINTSNKNKPSILELKARFNNEAPEELFKLINNYLN